LLAAPFRTEDVQTTDTTIHVRAGGQGPTIVLLRGFSDAGDMWAPLAADLAGGGFVYLHDPHQG
jgi:hypothetical protein